MAYLKYNSHNSYQIKFIVSNTDYLQFSEDSTSIYGSTLPYHLYHNQTSISQLHLEVPPHNFQLGQMVFEQTYVFFKCKPILNNWNYLSLKKGIVLYLNKLVYLGMHCSKLGWNRPSNSEKRSSMWNVTDGRKDRRLTKNDL